MRAEVKPAGSVRSVPSPFVELEVGKRVVQVLGDGAQFVWTDKGVTLDMDPGPDGIDNPDPDYRSGFFVTGAWCEWEKVPYTRPSAE